MVVYLMTVTANATAKIDAVSNIRYSPIHVSSEQKQV